MARQALWLTLSLLLLPWNGAGSMRPMFGQDKIRPGQEFSLDCNPDVANVPEGDDVAVLILAIRRLVQGEMKQVAMASLSMTPIFNKEYLPPVSRAWRVVHEGYGDDLKRLNRASVHLSLSTDQASCEDAGLYRCQAEYAIAARNISHQPATPTDRTIYCANDTGSMKPMFGQDKIRPGHEFSLDCNPDVANVPAGNDVAVLILTISRRIRGEMKEVVIAPPSITPVFNRSYLPPVSRAWRVVHEGYGDDLKRLNRASVHLSLSTDQASCEDAGLYRCQAEYAIAARNISHQPATPTDRTIYWDSEVVTLTVSPVNYTDGDILQLTCQSFHAETVEPSYRWNVSCGDEPFQNWPYESSNASREIHRDLDFPCRPQMVWNSRQWTFNASVACVFQCEESHRPHHSNTLTLAAFSGEKIGVIGHATSDLRTFPSTVLLITLSTILANAHTLFRIQ